MRKSIFAFSVLALLCWEVASFHASNNHRQETASMTIECVSAEISKQSNESEKWVVTLKMYIDPVFYTYFAGETNVPRISLVGDGFVVQPFKCDSKPKVVETFFGEFPTYRGLIEFSAEIRFDQGFDFENPIIGSIATPICSETTSYMVSKRFAAFLSQRGGESNGKEK